MVSKNQIKLITSLVQKKYRKQHGLFIAEGVKVINELIKSNFELEHLYITKPLFFGVSEKIKTLVTDSELKKISALTMSNDCLAVFKIPNERKIKTDGLIVALDDVRDPGNLGTIIRLCDWFGIEQLICSEQTVDLYNPKVVQATMGSISRVNVSYVDLSDTLINLELPIFGTFMDGENIYKTKLPSNGVIVLGNEANGISSEIEKIATHKIAIPRFGNLQLTESLNVATATAIVLSEFKRAT
ncbi:TrmH family RNA methyltransferase [Flavobacterium terrae]|uniref:RNA methyltransferase, TrmH family n=1 Tax=Flavobacterium terrae TaxID=415425 RepID=A0A1M6BND5_9FLAO|nr:RNA methyltransferase [Flavobacterium terrae]SHI50078.1 RNA methyltransferase, TrmH family [Flavobacterium terrae]